VLGLKLRASCMLTSILPLSHSIPSPNVKAVCEEHWEEEEVGKQRQGGQVRRVFTQLKQ
jgi:hypothetical protein